MSFTYTPLTLSATGGVAPFTWAVSAGSLPAGLSLSPNGSVFGEPTAAGAFTFTMQVTDAAGGIATTQASITIAPRLVASLIPACAHFCSVEVGCVSVCGNFGVLTGGAGPFTYTLQAGGYVPNGTTVSGLSLVGTFSAVARYWQFAVLVSDAFGGAAIITPTFYVYSHVTLASGSLTCDYNGCQPGSNYATHPKAFLYSGGSGSLSAKIAGWTFTGTCYGNPTPPNPCPAPASPTLLLGGGSVTVAVPSPGSTWINGYKGILTILLSDQSPCGAGAFCSTTATVAITVSGG